MKKIVMTAALAVGLGLTGCASTGPDVSSVGNYSMGRTIPERISDGSIELYARRQLSGVEGIDSNRVRIAIDSYRREVLLTGEVPSEAVKLQVEQIVSAMRDVIKVYNYLTVTDTPKSQSHTVHENYLRSKIVSRILASRQVKSSQYKIIVRDRTAYVLGYVTPQQQDRILQVIQDTSGMATAVTLTTLVNETPDQSTTLPVPYSEPVPQPAPMTGAPVQPDGAYTLPEIYTPTATTNAPVNAAPMLSLPSN